MPPDSAYGTIPDGATLLGGISIFSFLDEEAEEMWCYLADGMTPTKAVGLLEQVKLVIAHDACRELFDD
jgi:hypothetical protein